MYRNKEQATAQMPPRLRKQIGVRFPEKKHVTFTPEEEELIINLHAAIGSRWSIIAKQLPGRKYNDVKNYCNTKLKQKLSEMGIDHVTHRPFSQIISAFSNIGAFPSPRY
ncbi:transcription factor MYB35-like [Apium graveolens]|uniref:transcription factor MYB35-like n=1 Tax=Apium graveolens TaxID=4045 RepID=UPI003D7A5FB0